MPDRRGTPVGAGDRVRYFHWVHLSQTLTTLALTEAKEREGVPATVLRVTGTGEYLIQLDLFPPPSARDAETRAEVEDWKETKRIIDPVLSEIGRGPMDSQEPFEVPGDTIEVIGE